MANSTRFSGQLYQLRAKRPLPVGAYVAVNGPWDSFGKVMAVKDTNAEGTLHVIRGSKPIKGHPVAAQF